MESKYRNKHSETIELLLRERKCPKCELVYEVDYSRLPTETRALDEYFKFFCPYCGAITYVHV